MSAGEAVLVTGEPGTGKSTLLTHIADYFTSVPQAGFLTRELRRYGQRAGFEIVLPASGTAGLLAAPDYPSSLRFGSIGADGRPRLGVDLRFLETVACPTVRAALPTSRLVVVDEIGPMQACSPIFRGLVAEVLASRALLVASVALADDPWIEALAREAEAQGHRLRRGFVGFDAVRDLMVDGICRRLDG